MYINENDNVLKKCQNYLKTVYIFHEHL